MVLAPVREGHEAHIRRVLASMNRAPGRLNQDNPLIPFHQFPALHVARLLLLDDKTVDDVRAYSMTPGRYPLDLALLGDVDGDADAFLGELATRAPQGLRAIFEHCEEFTGGADLAGWMKAHNVGAAATYVNWRGRTVGRVREEAALYDAI